jgi:hypothetical protein
MEASKNSFRNSWIGLAGLHFLASCLLMLFGMATAYPSAATRSGPGLTGYVLAVLQAPLWLLTSGLGDALLDRHFEPTLLTGSLLILLSSLLYGYVLAWLLFRLRQLPHGGRKTSS